MFTKKIPDNAIQNIYNYDAININSICNKIHENNERRIEREKMMLKMTSLYSNDTDVQKTIQNCKFEFIDKALDHNMTVFMANYLFGDSIKRAAIKEVAAAERSLKKCFDEAEIGQENENKTNLNSSGRRRSSKKTKSSK